ncbi:CGNR zinc finger domain-containing protein [Rhizohabitans arisaemae]|uniref:CGNR zinc finger domain-containing protein n=1 Tax=Rhizohabitans arisaemae TaxID=2720610 RepID=UPI0024B18EFE|nr:CGNR zinc finger domain-containing protein [Rhizohabitans arisaemae]
MNLASYAELAVALVNTDAEVDRLGSMEALQELLADRPALARRASRADLDSLRDLRAELRAIFESVAAKDAADAVERLNTLLILHPIYPQISTNDNKRWHLHLTEVGRVADQYTVGAVMGLATVVTDRGIDRLGTCLATPCRNIYLDTSSNRSRRYCSGRCASRANVAAYRARKRANPKV